MEPKVRDGRSARAATFAVIGCVMLSVGLTGCPWYASPGRIFRLDIVGAQSLVVGGIGSSRVAYGTNQLYKLMPSGALEVVSAYDRNDSLMTNLYNVVGVKDINADWVLVNYGWESGQVLETYLVEKTTGNVFYLSDIVTDREHAYGLPTLFAYGDEAYLNGFYDPPDDEYGNTNVSAVYHLDVSSPHVVVGTRILGADVNESIGWAIVAQDSTILYQWRSNTQDRLMVRFPDGSVQQITDPAGMSGPFLMGGTTFYEYRWSEVIAIETQTGEAVKAAYPCDDVVPNNTGLPVEIVGRWYIVGTVGIVDVTDVESTGCVQMHSHSYDLIDFIVPHGEAEIAIYGVVANKSRLDLVNTTDWSTNTVWSNGEYILDSLASAGTILYMGGLIGATGSKAVITYNGTLTHEEMPTSSEPITITPIN